MNRFNTELPKVELPEPPKQSWFTKYHLWGYAFLALTFLLVVGLIYQMEYGRKPQESRICIQVETTARSPYSGETGTFPTPCDIPEGWEIVPGVYNEIPDLEISDVENLSWKKYVNEYFGFEMDVLYDDFAKNVVNDDVFVFSLETKPSYEPIMSEDGIAHVTFLNSESGKYKCDKGIRSYHENGWDIESGEYYFCAQNGIYKLKIRFYEDNPELARHVLKSIHFKPDNKLVQPKYYLNCTGIEYETNECSLYSNGINIVNGVFNRNLVTGEKISLKGIESVFRLYGWDDENVYITNGSGDACNGSSYVYAFDLNSKVFTNLFSYSYSCNDTAEYEAKAKLDFNELLEELNSRINLYPRFNF